KMSTSRYSFTWVRTCRSRGARACRTRSSRSNTTSRAKAPTPPPRRGRVARAPAAAALCRGCSALAAVELMDTAWNFRREHLRIQQRSHYVITNGGDQPNVVPRLASAWYYFRELDYDHIKQMREIGDQMAQGAALMTNTEVSSRVLGCAWPQH